MKISDEDAKLLFDVDQISARLDVLYTHYAQHAIKGYTAESTSEVEANVDSLKKNTLKALAGVDSLIMSLAALKASVAQLIAQNNRTLLGVLQRSIEPTEPSDSDQRHS